MDKSRSNNTSETDVTQKGRLGKKEREGGYEKICKEEAAMVRRLRGGYLITGVLGWWCPKEKKTGKYLPGINKQ